MIKIRPTEVEDASQVATCIDSVAREKRFLANTEGFPVEQTAEYIKFIKNAGGIHLIISFLGASVR